MTVKQLLEKGVQLLTESGIDNARNEARWIFESAFECGRDYSVLYGNSEADSEKAERFLRMTAERQGGLPVQYVIGEWDFFSLEKGLDLDTPNKEVKMTVIDKTCDTVTFRMQYRRNEKCVTVSASGEEHFSDEANAYGFSFVFRIRD